VPVARKLFRQKVNEVNKMIRKKLMNHKIEPITKSLLTSALIVLFILTGNGLLHAETADASKVTFFVA